ncbi:MAG: 2,3-bisphosphoglycerate-independent phosphoglycerate mutase [Halobacteriaceae archaeon]
MDAALVILDGWGVAPPDQRGRDAVGSADTPAFDALRDAGASNTVRTDGPTVGLPAGQMGNSEVGHLTIGAGRIVKQAYTRIEEAIEDDALAAVDAIAGAFDHVRATGGRLHLMGLVSDGGVHGDYTHLTALIDAAADRDIPATTHAFTDGRDTSPTAGERFVAALERAAAAAGTGGIATLAGRYYAMDRDQHWDRTHQVYDAIVNRRASHDARSGVAAVQAGYDRGETDEFIEPTIVTDRPALADGDAVIFCNFRADRARQLVRMLGDVDPDWPQATTPPDTHLVTMTEYDRTFPFPVAFPPREPNHVLGAVVAEAECTQLRVAESEKYAHVTYFLNGGREIEFDGEIRRIVPSPDVPTYDQQPAMSAPAVTDTTLEVLDADDPDLLVVNYANADMVGHTGDFEAAVAAVEAVDTELARLRPALEAADSHVIVTADHGNADDMGTPEEPHTAHTFNPVPVTYLAPDGTDGGHTIPDPGELRDLAPTILSLLDLAVPAEMTDTSLLD